eukprot:3833169-Rhodomonas_salina.2
MRERAARLPSRDEPCFAGCGNRDSCEDRVDVIRADDVCEIHSFCVLPFRLGQARVQQPGPPWNTQRERSFHSLWRDPEGIELKI